MDVALLALVYLSIGFYHKDLIERWTSISNSRYDLTAAAIAGLLIVFCIFNYWDGNRLYYFDMKPVYYKEIFLAIAIPCAFGVVLCRLTYWITRLSVLMLNSALCYLGRMTVPIMFLHIPLNTLRDSLGYGAFAYSLIGICIPVILTLTLNRFKVFRRLFGLPGLSW